jgi:sulfide:quinone oxidoreductase
MTATAGDVVVLGAGTGGLVAARRLARGLRSLNRDGRVVLIDRDLTYRFAPSFLWVMTGARRPEQITFDLGRLGRWGIRAVRADVLEIDVEERTVKTTEGGFPYDRLVIALGAELAPQALPGFAEGAHDVYTLDGAASAGRALQDFGGGRVAVVVSRLPYKCPAAPYEAALLAEAMLRRRGVRSGSTVDVYTPEPFPMPTAGPVVGEALAGILQRRGIELHPNRSVDEIEPDGRRLAFPEGERASYDLLLGVPPHRAPEAVRTSELAGQSGFIPVDAHTLRTEADGVFAIGDVTQIPIAGGKFLPKAGVFAHGEAEVVAGTIVSELAGRAPTAVFDGKGSCFVEMGDGVAAFATGEFYAAGAPEVHLRRPGRRWHLAKVAFERYWLRRWL